MGQGEKQQDHDLGPTSDAPFNNFLQMKHFQIRQHICTAFKWLQNKFLLSYLNYFQIHLYQLIQTPTLPAS
jgi:hypothetical protein